MASKKYGIDLDGCLVNFNKAYGDAFKKRGFALPDYTTAEPHTWNYPEALGVPKDVVREVWREDIGQSPNFWRDLPPHFTATDDLFFDLRVRETVGDELYFMTSRPGVRVQQQTTDWLKREVGLKNPHVLIVPGRKGPIAHELRLDFFCDDKPETIEEFDAYKDEMAVYQILRPYNRHVYVHGIIAVPNVHEALRNFDERARRSGDVLKEAA